jgi:hypothetical protein
LNLSVQVLRLTLGATSEGLVLPIPNIEPENKRRVAKQTGPGTAPLVGHPTLLV